MLKSYSAPRPRILIWTALLLVAAAHGSLYAEDCERDYRQIKLCFDIYTNYEIEVECRTLAQGRFEMELTETASEARLVALAGRNAEDGRHCSVTVGPFDCNGLLKQARYTQLTESEYAAWLRYLRDECEGLRSAHTGFNVHTGTYDPIGQLGLHAPNPPIAERTLQAGPEPSPRLPLAHKAGSHAAQPRTRRGFLISPTPNWVIGMERTENRRRR